MGNPIHSKYTTTADDLRARFGAQVRALIEERNLTAVQVANSVSLDSRVVWRVIGGAETQSTTVVKICEALKIDTPWASLPEDMRGWLLRTRKQKRVSQQNLADALGLARAWYSSIERNDELGWQHLAAYETLCSVPDNPFVPDTIDSLRKSVGLSWSELSEKSGLPEKWLSSLTRPFSVAVAEKIADALGVLPEVVLSVNRRYVDNARRDLRKEKYERISRLSGVPVVDVIAFTRGAPLPASVVARMLNTIDLPDDDLGDVAPFAEWLRKEMEGRDLNASKLAALSGISRDTISDTLHEKREPTEETKESLRRALTQKKKFGLQETLAMDFGVVLREAREQQGLSLADLARMSDCPNARTVEQNESGTGSGANVDSLCKALGIESPFSTLPENVGKWIRSNRDWHGISRSDLAQRSGVNANLIHAFERNARTGHKWIFLALYRSLTELIGEKND